MPVIPLPPNTPHQTILHSHPNSRSLFGQQKIITQFPSLNFHHSSLITHHLSLITHFFTLIWQHHFYFHHSIFSHYSWVPHLSADTMFFLFSFFQYPTHRSQYYLKKKKKTERPTQEKKRKEKKKNTNSQRQPRKRKRKKKVKRWSKVTAVGPLCVFNYNIAIEL